MVNAATDYRHVTQTGFFITVAGTSGTTVIFCADRWADFAGNGNGYNQWCPVTFSGTTPIFNSLTKWAISAISTRLAFNKESDGGPEPLALPRE